MSTSINIHSFLDKLAAGEQIPAENEHYELPEGGISQEAQEKILAILEANQDNIGKRDLDNLGLIREKLGLSGNRLTQKIDSLIAEGLKLTPEDLPTELLPNIILQGDLELADLRSLCMTSFLLKAKLQGLISEAKLAVDQFMSSAEYRELSNALKSTLTAKTAEEGIKAGFKIDEAAISHLCRRGLGGKYYAKAFMDRLYSEAPMLAELIGAAVATREIWAFAVDKWKETMNDEEVERKLLAQGGSHTPPNYLESLRIFREKLHGSSLRNLYFLGSDITGEAMKSQDFIRILEKYPNLEKLSAAHAEDLDKDVLDWIITNLKKIKRIQLDSSESTRDEKIEELQRAYPGIIITNLEEWYHSVEKFQNKES